MAKHIGIVACSAEGAALCYKTICGEIAQRADAQAQPEVSLHNHPFDAYAELLAQNDWAKIGELMLSSACKLANAGAGFLICPDNTIHNALPAIEPHLPLPWLHIADIVAAEAGRRGFRRVGLTGTRWLVESDAYPGRLRMRGIDFVRPEEEDRREMSRIIMEELVKGEFKPSSVAIFQRVIEKLKAAGADSVVLGCTEIPLIIDDSNSALPTLDSTRLLARAAIDRALSTA